LKISCEEADAVTEQEKTKQFAESAPPLQDGELEAINALFPTYIFRRSKTQEVWTSCCHRQEVLPPWERQSAYERELMIAAHQREPKGWEASVPQEETRCPFCGKLAIVKELRYTGKRDNLSRYRRAVILRWYRGTLWARAYDCGKHYSKDRGYSLTGEPVCKLVGVYRFQPGLAEATTRGWWGDCPFTRMERQDEPLTKGRWNIHSPFHANAEYGVGYDVIGLDEIQESPFRYCMAAEAEHKFNKFLEFLTACCFYPRQIEMLMKAGMYDVVRDLVERGVKHAAVIDWDEQNPAKVFGLSRQDLKTFLGTSRDIRIVELFKKLKGRVPLTECAEWVSNGLNIQQTFQAAKKWNLTPERLIRYLDRNTECVQYGSLNSILRYWKDYLTAAEAMNYPLHRENVLLPGNLSEAHDEATAAHQEKLDRERLIRQREREHQWEVERAERDRLAAASYSRKRRGQLEKKYSFSLDGYIIRVPTDKEEILDEGRKLRHCVGGYADRHISGDVTILFMRKEAHPDTPWLTIEMSGNELVQIHGFKNEGIHTAKGQFAPDPREIYKDFLNTWLDWLEKGSKRDKDGRAKLPGKKGAAA